MKDKAQREALEKLRDGEPVQVFPKTVAQGLIDAGLVREARLDPAPKDGIAINMTAKGRGALVKAGKEPAADTPLPPSA